MDDRALPDRLELVISGKSQTVLDPFILNDLGGPIPAKRFKSADGRMLFTWSLKVPADNNTLRVDFRLWVPPDGGGSSITADILGYRPVFNAKGKCAAAAS